MGRDRHRLSGRVRGLDSALRQGRAGDDSIRRVVEEIERSAEIRRRRREQVPKITFPEELPVVARRKEIADAIAANQVVVLCGETGSGKTTQLPKICLELGRGVAGMIGHTQPRRIAARSVATRLAQELGVRMGRSVGFKVRFGDQTSEDTHIKVMTDGILLAETQGDRFLDEYDTLIIDEAHERSLNIDFLLGYIKQLLPRRPELKVIITSATIDPQRFSRHFDNAPVIEVSGRTYPVEVRYRPLMQESGEQLDVEEAIHHAVDELEEADLHGPAPGQGDILIFLSGEREIRETAESLRKRGMPNTEVIPLYARLTAAEQMRVFQPHSGRRIVLATNVAETSLTVPGIRYVIDPGEARISRYSARTKVQRLPIEAISRASADQRKGRCGRLEAGVCIRLFSEQDYAERPAFTDPEISRTNLASVILQMKSLRLGPVEEFPFVEPPDSRMIRDGYETLRELRAVDEKGELTKLGAELARLPIDPRIGRMILEAHRENALSDVLVIAAALSIQDPRERPMDAQDAADRAHAEYKDEDSDFAALLKLWKVYHDEGRHLGTGKLRKWCRERFLSFTRLREWGEVRQQLDSLVTEMGYRAAHKPSEYGALHRSLLAGLLTSVGLRSAESAEYAGARGTKFNIFPGSGLFKKGPQWIMASEIVMTTKMYGRTVAKIQPEWVEQLASHLIQRSHTDPRWDATAGQVFASERVTLFGLELVAKRRVLYGAVEPVKAREVFIHHALVEGEIRSRGRFLEYNAGLLEEVRKIAAKARRTDLIVEAEARYAFFDRVIPPDVNGTQRFEAWRQHAEKSDPRVLFMSREDLLVEAPAEVTAEQYPDRAAVGDGIVPLDYVFDSASPSDGVTLTLPVQILAQADADGAEALVPALHRERVRALVRSLPKGVRKYIPDAVISEAAEAIRRRRGTTVELLAEELSKRLDVRVSRDDFNLASVPQHLSMNFRVIDSSGRELARGRDLVAIRKELGPRIRSGLTAGSGTAWVRDGLVNWDFGDLPEHVNVERGGMVLRGYPALVDVDGVAGLRLFDSAEAARGAMHAGVRRLLAARARDEIRHQIRTMPGLGRMNLHYSTIGSAAQLSNDLAGMVAERAFLTPPLEIRNAARFEAALTAGWKGIARAAREVAAVAEPILAGFHAVSLQVGAFTAGSFAATMRDVQNQMTHLFARGFFLSTPPERLAQFPRYLAAIQTRLSRLGNTGLERDTRQCQDLLPRWQRYFEATRAERTVRVNEEQLVLYRWMIEEWRVSLFAQEIGTSMPVSAKRVDEQWERVVGP